MGGVIPGLCTLIPDEHYDMRGGFFGLFPSAKIRALGLDGTIADVCASWSYDAGTLRGLHYQIGPAAQAKTVRCIRGSLYDVVLDLRPRSPAYKQWCFTHLSRDNRFGLYVPEGCAHGLMTLEDDTEALYTLSAPQNIGCERGIRWDDPAFGIKWPMEPTVMSDKDKSWPDYAA